MLERAILGKYDVPFGYYCGPTALMLVSNVEYTTIRSLVNENKRRRPNQGIIGMSYSDMEHCISNIRLNFTKHDLRCEKLMLKEYDFTGYWIVNVAQHFVAIVDNEIADNHHVWWTAIKDSARQRQRIKIAYKIW